MSYKHKKKVFFRLFLSVSIGWASLFCTKLFKLSLRAILVFDLSLANQAKRIKPHQECSSSVKGTRIFLTFGIVYTGLNALYPGDERKQVGAQTVAVLTSISQTYYATVQVYRFEQKLVS